MVSELLVGDRTGLLGASLEDCNTYWLELKGNYGML